MNVILSMFEVSILNVPIASVLGRFIHDFALTSIDSPLINDVIGVRNNC